METAFSGNPLNRLDSARHDPAVLADWPKRPGARLMLFSGDKVLTDADGAPVWLDPGLMDDAVSGERVFLGIDDRADGAACFAAGLRTPDTAGKDLAAKDLAGKDLAATLETPETGCKFRDLRSVGMKALGSGIARDALGIMAQAKSMLDWHARHRFCANCGTPTRMTKSGYERRCDACGAAHFPRTDPVVIMLAFHGDAALVGRSHKMPPGFYSALAGFMEPGESIEEAVARELKEETGVDTTSVRYVASQPWPWPSSIMIGCTATVAGRALTLDRTEIAEARWITKAEARTVMAGRDPDIAFPPPIAIAHDLLRHWLDDAGSL